MPENDASGRAAGWGGAAAICCFATGLVGWVGALVCFFRADGAGLGSSLLASALAFGLLANAVFRR